ncbi:MAG TPA: aminoacetone oxidase family FAD-binding enzyme [Candidatus Paceibacterota bacterium]|nr:aminoacetone oxidase family FAD-binding enzyme [Candidatus Paceibacterota bacterium]
MTPDPHRPDVIVIGGGAAGLMAAGRAAERGKRVLLFEKNERLGKKLRITGGGRCNITNAEEDIKTLLKHYGSAEQFLYSPFSEFGMEDTFTFFESRGLPLMVEARKRAFPKSENAQDVVRTLAAYVERGKVDVRLGTPVRKVVVADGKIAKIVASGGEYVADSYIFATGGVSHPETGSTGDGFAWLRELGHSVEDPTPTIVPLKAKDAWIQALVGKTFPQAKITFYTKREKKFSATGNILLTHFGLSGPTILNSAGKVADLLHEGPVTATIDLFPTFNIGELDTKLREHFDANKNKLLKNVAPEFLPPGTTDGLLALVPVDPEKKVHSVTKEERRALVDTFKALPVTISGLMGYDRAVVADGGVRLTEMDMRTMRSLRSPNLFVIGDLLHITRPSGGYSLQLCWTTGYIAGNSA